MNGFFLEEPITYMFPLVDCCNDKYDQARCEYYQQKGLCRTHPAVKRNCRRTCFICTGGVSPLYDPKKKILYCRNSRWGCCKDETTVKHDEIGSNCPGIN